MHCSGDLTSIPQQNPSAHLLASLTAGGAESDFLNRTLNASFVRQEVVFVLKKQETNNHSSIFLHSDTDLESVRVWELFCESADTSQHLSLT